MSNINITSTNQSGGITAHTVNIGPTARSMNEQIGQQLKQHIPTSAKVSVTAVMGDGEAFGFANQVLAWLRANGYATDEGVNQAVYSQPVMGEILEKKDDSQFELIIGSCQTPVQPTNIKRDWAKPSPVQPANITYNYNVVVGTGARMNNNSTDSSVNVISIEVTEVFSQVRKAVSKIPDPTARSEIERAVDEMEKAHGTSNFKQKYNEFITSAANHMTVLSPIIGAVTGLLT